MTTEYDEPEQTSVFRSVVAQRVRHAHSRDGDKRQKQKADQLEHEAFSLSGLHRCGNVPYCLGGAYMQALFIAIPERIIRAFYHQILMRAGALSIL